MLQKLDKRRTGLRGLGWLSALRPDISVTGNGPTMFARIGMMRALNWHKRACGEIIQPSKEGREEISDRSMISCKAIAAVLFLASTGLAMPGDVTWQASIIDGDTLEIHRTRIRL